MRRRRRFVRVPPDLTSLFDVLFIVIFAALIRAAAAEQKPPEPPPPPPPPKLDPAALQVRAADQLAARPMIVVRVSAAAGTITAIEHGGKAEAVDVPLLEHSADPDVGVAYLGERSSEQRVCRIAELHAGELAKSIVVIAPDRALVDLPHALYDGLRADVDRCAGLAVIVDPSATPRR